MGLMDKLSSLAAGPAGQVLGGFLEGEIEERRLEAEKQRKKDEAKAGLVTYTQKRLIDENIKNINTSNKKYDSIETLRKRGIPEYIIYEMDRNGYFNQENPNNALSTAEEVWGSRFWADESNPYYKEFAKRSGQYEVPDIAKKYQTSAAGAMTSLSSILNGELGIGDSTTQLLTSGLPKQEPTKTETTTMSTDAAGSNITQDKIPAFPVIKAPATKDVEETQFRMALQDPNYLIRLGFDIDRDSDFTAEGNFNWAAFMSKSPEANAAVTLLNQVAPFPYSAISNGRASDVGLGHMVNKHTTAGKVNELALANTVGVITSDVVKAVAEDAHKVLIVDTIRKNNPGLDIGNYTTEKLVSMLDRTNPNWLSTFKNLDYQNLTMNPFMGTPLESIMTPTETGFTISENKLQAISDEDYRETANNKLNSMLYDPRKPITYLQLRDLHSKYYGTQSTLTTESGLLAPDDPIFAGSGRSDMDLTPGGPTADDIAYSEKYVVPSTVAFKKDKVKETYSPVKGMGETTSVLLSGTDMDTPEKIDNVLKQYVNDIEGLEQYVMALLLEQQQEGMLPKQLTMVDIQMLKDSLMDDIFTFEYEVKEDKSDAGGSIDETDTEEEVVKNVEDAIIPDIGPVDSEINPAFLELESKQQARKNDLKKVTDSASTVVETAKDVVDSIQKNKNLSIEEKRKLADEREEKVINWFKNLFTGE